MLEYLMLIFDVAIGRSVDIAQSVIFFAMVFVGVLAWAGLPKSAVDKMTVLFTAGKYLVVILLAVVATRLLMAPYWIWQDGKQLRIETQNKLEAVIEERDQVRRELIAKRDRSAQKANLMKFYADASRLAAGGGLTKESSEEDFQKYVEQTGEWRDEVSAWLQDNMGQGAAAKFQDITPYLNVPYFRYSSAINSDHNWRMNLVGYWRRNLAHLIESDHWDQQ